LRERRREYEPRQNHTEHECKNEHEAVSLMGYLLAKIGRADEAREVLKTLEGISRDRYVPPYAMALVYAGLDQRDALFEWLDKAYDARDVHLIFLPVDPKWDGYRSDPRFAALLTCCRFSPGTWTHRVAGRFASADFERSAPSDPDSYKIKQENERPGGKRLTPLSRSAVRLGTMMPREGEHR